MTRTGAGTEEYMSPEQVIIIDIIFNYWYLILIL